MEILTEDIEAYMQGKYTNGYDCKVSVLYLAKKYETTIHHVKKALNKYVTRQMNIAVNDKPDEITILINDENQYYLRKRIKRDYERNIFLMDKSIEQIQQLIKYELNKPKFTEEEKPFMEWEQFLKTRISKGK